MQVLDLGIALLAFSLGDLLFNDFGLKPLHSPGPEDLCDVINERYEQGSIMLTSNRALDEWLDFLGDPLLASAGLDRLSHRAHVLIITGNSFRAHRPPSLKQEVHTESSD